NDLAPRPREAGRSGGALRQPLRPSIVAAGALDGDQASGPARGGAERGVAAPVAAFLREPPARPRRRPAPRAGHARPRRHRHAADLHPLAILRGARDVSQVSPARSEPGELAPWPRRVTAIRRWWPARAISWTSARSPCPLVAPSIAPSPPLGPPALPSCGAAPGWPRGSPFWSGHGSGPSAVSRGVTSRGWPCRHSP